MINSNTQHNPIDIKWNIWMLDNRIEQSARFKQPDTLQLIKEKIILKIELRRIESSN
jgi:hypothetical protein